LMRCALISSNPRRGSGSCAALGIDTALVKTLSTGMHSGSELIARATTSELEVRD